MKNLENLSREAQRLIELTTKKSGYGSNFDIDPEADMSAILAKEPELTKGLNEYLAWRDEVLRAEGQEEPVGSLRHEVAKNVAALARKRPAKNLPPKKK